ncbi:MAG: methyltransferase domain-containing protein [Burkholderiales bacterium]|nr:methyltransferase domain-containing protein [Burkholderiales bacterium]
MRRTAALLVAALVAGAAAGQEKAGPYVPSPTAIVDEMLALAGVRAGDFVIDLGSGDGRIVITAAERYGARGLGVDIDPALVALATDNARRAGVADRVRFVEGDLFAAAVGEASVVTVYLLPHSATRLAAKLRQELPAGARIVSHDYALAPWPEDRAVRMEVPEKVAISGSARTVLYLYVVPARVGGDWVLELPAGVARGPVRLIARDEPFRAAADAVVGGRRIALGDFAVSGTAVAFTLPAAGAGRLRLEGRVAGDGMEGEIAGRPGVTWRARRIR